jgi:AcrR family transcriptional regulator
MTAARELRRPGRPRSVEADRAILEAALVEYAARGLDGLTVDAVAARAGVGKATIYRRYPCKMDLVMAAAEAISTERAPVPRGDGIRADLLTVLRHLRHLLLDTPAGPSVRQLVADAPSHPDLARAHRAFIAERRAGTRRLVEQAIARGELRAVADPDVVCDLAVAPLFHRYLVVGAPMPDVFLDAVVDAVVRAFAP